jgi:predicted rRNA methylase YqxC with S4 and FtsJ domains
MGAQGKTKYILLIKPQFEVGKGNTKKGIVKAQIEKTLTDLSDIDNVVISINGQTEGILEP